MGNTFKRKKVKVFEDSSADELRRDKEKWIKETNFAALPVSGQEAFKEFTKSRELDEATRRLEFWFAKPEDQNLSVTLSDYLKIVCKLPEVRSKGGSIDVEEILSKVSHDNLLTSDEADNGADHININKVQKVLHSAAKIDNCVALLKEQMRPDLNDIFDEFKDYLKEELQKEKDGLPKSASKS